MRHNFSTRTKNAALEAAGGICRGNGPMHGLEPGTRCAVILVAGNREFDHWPLPAHADGSDGVENCVPLCKKCHAWKTAHYDIPAEAKIKRVRKRYGLDPPTRKPRPRMKGRPMQNSKRPIPHRPFPKRGTTP